MLVDADPFESLATPVAWLDAAGALRECNPAFAHWLGVGRRRLLGLPATTLSADAQLGTGLARVQAQGAAIRLRRARFAFPGGEERFADVWLVPDAQDGTLRLEAHPVDEFPGEDPATALPAALTAALKGLAHELRNPLAGLKGAAQLLGRRMQDPESRELVALISDEVERLNALLQRILTPAAPRPFEPVNIHPVLERVRQLAEAEAGWAVKVHRDYDPSLPNIEGDADRLVQALWNLLRNALEAGASNVSLRTRAEHGVLIGEQAHRLALRVEIADDGRGVPEDLTERLFLPLVTGRADGTGLGLPLAQQIAREHRGSLGYRSRPGHTVFTLLLPVPQREEVSP